MYQILHGSCFKYLTELKQNSIRTCVTSPPYFGLRDYKTVGQIGTEHTPEQYVERLVAVFREVRKLLTEDGTLWVNLGDSYAGTSTGGFRPGSGRADGKVDTRGQRNRNGLPCPPGMKPKDLMGIPWTVALALRNDGWFLRQDIIWYKPNAMPEPSMDRCTKAHEYLFLLSKSKRYFFNAAAIQEASDYDLRNKRSVWAVPTQHNPNTNFATFPPDLVRPCILASSEVGDSVLDPFSGTAVTGVVAIQNSRTYIGIEINENCAAASEQRLAGVNGVSNEYIQW